MAQGAGMSPLERFRRSGGWNGGSQAGSAPQPGPPVVDVPTDYPRPTLVTEAGTATSAEAATSPSQLPADDSHAAFGKLSAHAVAVPALASNVRPALVLRERQARGLLAEARRHDVGVGGSFSAGPAGIQVWSGPFDGPGGSHGSAVHLGSVDWIYDTPVRYYATIYRAMVTAQGLGVAHTPHTILDSVLQLTGLTVEGTRLTMPMPPPRDPFRRRA